MIIETYTDKYYDDVVEIVKNFYTEAIQYYDIGLDVEVLAETIATLKQTDKGNAFLMIVDGKCQGLLAGVEAPSMLNTKRIFQEVIWYVNETYRMHGITLLKKVEAILRTQGFNKMIMAVLECSKTDKLKAFYEKMGFKKFETHYLKEL